MANNTLSYGKATTLRISRWGSSFDLIVVVWHERLGMSADDIATEYGLTLADVFAALTYYYDNRSEIDQVLQDEEAFVEQLRKCTPSKLKEKLGI